MRGTSLQARLFISYVILVGIVIGVIAIGIVLSLTSSPILYRTITQRLRLASDVVALQLEDQPLVTLDSVYSYLYTVSAQTQLRVGLLTREEVILFDSGISLYPAFPDLDVPEERLSGYDLPVHTFRDEKGGVWFYTTKLLKGGYLVIVMATQRPEQVLRTIFREELGVTTVIAGFIAIVLALIFSFAMANWISKPLERLVAGAQSVASGKHNPLPLKGPREVRMLSQAFNDMSSRVFASQQSQKDFVTNVSHELKTPITSIRGYAQAILDGTVLGEESIEQAATIIFNEANRMHGMVMDLLTLAKLETGIADMQMSLLDLRVLLDHLLERFTVLAHQNQIELVSNYSNLAPVMGDGEQILRVFTNLLENALKYTPAGGRISVSALQSGNWIVVQFSDTGPGIPVEDRERIFERFYQVDASRRGGLSHGVGLGLAIAREIVLSHGGMIRVESELGKGSIFSVELPVCSEVSTVNG